MAIHACFKCFIYFRHMFQVFHLDISKVDLGKAHVAVGHRATGVIAHACWWWCCCC
jgi:hypothetical protein